MKGFIIIIAAFILSFPAYKIVMVLSNFFRSPIKTREMEYSWSSGRKLFDKIGKWGLTFFMIMVALTGIFGGIDNTTNPKDTTHQKPIQVDNKKANTASSSKQTNNSVKDQINTSNNASEDKSKMLGTYSYKDEMGSEYSISLDKGEIGTETSYKAEWKIKWRLNGNQLTIIGGGMTTIYTVKDKQLISKDGVVYTKE